MSVLNGSQEILKQGNIINNPGNAATGIIKTAVMEVKQTNVVKFNNTLESVAVDTRDINKICALCNNAQKVTFPVAEVFLSIASIFAGGFIGALISGISINASFQSILFYIISPVITVGCGVAYIYNRKNEQTSLKTLASQILEHLNDSNSIEDDGGTEHES